MTLLAAAIDLAAHGCSVVPVRTDGTKAPAVTWKAGQAHRAELGQLEAWFTGTTYDGLGVITGTISGNLEMFEIEGRANHLTTRLATLMNDNGFGDLWTRLCAGYLEQSPSGGLHWLYRVDGPARGNTKLSRRPSTEDELAEHQATERAKAHTTISDPDQRAARLAKIDALTRIQVPQVLIETRGEGGFTVTAPSGGRSHPTGQPWRILAGNPATIPTITVDERDALHAIANMLDEMPAADPGPDRHLHAVGTTPAADRPGDRPGDDYNNRANWDDILTPHGWARTRHFGGHCYGWTRPGKNPGDGISATTGRNDADNLYVFSSSTEFDTEKAYSKFGAYTHLEHAGDYAAAARALRTAGYGTPSEEARPANVIDLIPTPTGTPPPATETDTPGNGAGPGNGGTPPPPTRITREPTSYSHTDDGNALRLVDTHGDTVRYCPQRGSWLSWDSHRWVWDEALHIHELARDVARALPTPDNDAIKHRRASLSARGITSMVSLARSDRRVVAHAGALDAHPYQLNTPAGVVDLTTGQVLAPDPAMLHTRSTNVAPADGPAPRWETFLAETFAGDPDLTTYVQRILGQAIIGTVLEQILPFAFGAGANGKTTLLGVVQRIIGIGDQGYSISSPADLLLATFNQGHPTEIARLAGARFVVTSELEDGQRFAEAKVKMLTGRDTISGRFMRQDWFSFTPTHTLFLAANHQPEVRAGGTAFWRRLALLPFVHTVPPEHRNPHLEDQLVEGEGPQILNWLIQGAVDYLTYGITAPGSVTAATAAYATDQDTVARFVADCCELGPIGAQTYSVASSQVRAVYERWCTQEGEQPIPAKTLTTQLTSRFNIASRRTKSTRMLDGVRLRADASDDDHDASPTEPADGQPELGSDPNTWWKR